MTTRPTKPKKVSARELKRAMATAVEQFRAWGREGARRRAEKLSPEEREAIARKAALARWKKAGK